MRVAIADTCFLINWLRFRGRDDIFRVYECVAVPLLVLDELGSRRGMLADWIISGRAFFVPRVTSFEVEALGVVELARARRLPRVDPAEAYCLVVARHRGYDVLTDNRAVKYLVREVKEYGRVRVLDSLDVLVAVYGDDPAKLKRAVVEYSRETGLTFSRRRLEELGLLPE